MRAGEVIAKVFAGKTPGAPAADIETERKRLTDCAMVSHRQASPSASEVPEGEPECPQAPAS